MFNTTDNSELKPGYYFWFDSRWVRLISSTDDFLEDVAQNEELAVDPNNQTLFLRDSKNRVVSVPLHEVNVLTTLESNADGTYTYTSEDQTQTTIDIAADVIQNITQILQDNSVKNEIIQAISLNAKDLTGDSMIAVTGGDGAVLTTTALSINNNSITTAKIAAGGAKQLLVTDATGVVKWVDASDEVIQEAFEFNEKVTLLVDAGDGTFTYYNEKEIDANGNPMAGTGVKFDANTLRIEKTADNAYAFYDKTSDTTPIATIDVAGSVIENITEILNDTTVQNDIYHTVAAQGKAATAADGSIAIDNGDQAVLNAMQISVAPGGITTAKIAAGGAKQLLVTDATGVVKWVDASDDIIQEAFEFNEKVTLLVDAGDGTFTYYNEKEIDANGNPMAGTGVKFDANTLRIEKTADNAYAFYDKTSDTTPIATIDVAGSVIENITEILNDTTVQNDIYHTVAAQGKAATAADGSIAIDNGDQAVLNAMQISVAAGGITTEKIAAGDAKQLLVTDATGVVKWVDASDEVIQEAFEFNEKVTLVVDGRDGTFTYYNEKEIDANGNPIAGTGVKFDANTLNIKERTGAEGKGIYDFYDGTTSLQNPLMTINTRAKAIVFENSSATIEGDNLQDVVNNLIAKVERAQGNLSPIKGAGILINEQLQVDDAVLQELTLSIANEAVTESKIAEGAVTAHKIKNKAVTLAKIAPGANKQILVTKEGQAQWVPATDSIIQEVVKQNEVVTLIENNGDGTYSYYNENSIDATGAPIKANEILIDANTLTITEQPNGTYVFTDGTYASTGLPLATINIAGTVIENITEILNDTTVQNDIYHAVAAQGKAATAADGSIVVDNGDQAVLNPMQISVAAGGITTAKIAAGGAKQLLVTDATGVVKWVDASDEVIQDAFEFNEKVTLLVDAGDGTFTYYNEKEIDANGNPIAGTGVKFDANTLRIEKTTDNAYAFYDKTSDTTPIATIDVAGSVIENITEILNDTTVQNDIYHAVAAQGKAVSSPDSSIKIGGDGDKAVLNTLMLSIEEEGVSTAALAPKAVTTDKILGGVRGQLLVTSADGVAQWMSASDDEIKEILSLNQAITELIDNQDGTFTYFNEGDYDANGVRKPSAVGTTFNANTLSVQELNDPQTGAPTGVFAFYDLSQDDPIATIDVGGTVTEQITNILNEEEVQNQIFATVAAKGKKMQSTDHSIAITGGDKAVLKEVIVNVQQGGIKTDHLADAAVTPAKINAVGAEPDAILTADGLGNASFETPKNAVSPAMQGDLAGEAGVVLITGGGENVLFGDTSKKVTIGINERGIASKHIGVKAVKEDNLADQAVSAVKLKAKAEEAGHVAMVNADGTVSYLPLTSTIITDRGTVSTDGSVTVDDGVGKVLEDFTIGIAEKGIDARKLDATGAAAGAVATANADGTVSYKPLEASAITAKGDITTDNIIVVDNGVGKVLDDVHLTIADGGITGVQLADKTIEIEKLVAGPALDKRVLVTDDAGEVKWGELGDIVTDTAGNLTTDGIVEIQDGDGVNSLLYNVKLGIKAESITNSELADKTIEIGKLSSAGSTEGMVMITDATGGFTYVARETIVQAGEDLTLDNSLEFLTGNGVSAVLADTKIGIKAGGITEAKLADAAVTPQKISAEGAEENAVLTADGLGNVTYKKINPTAFEGTEADLKSDGSLSIPQDNKAVLNEVTIGIAPAGVGNSHLATKAVTTDKIDAQTAAGGTVLTADGSGNATFKTLGDVAQTAGQAVSSSDQSIAVPAGNKAALQPLNLTVAQGGIKSAHLAPGAVTEDKISTEKGAGLVLTSTVDGGAEFQSLGSVIGDSGKAITGAATIEVTGGEHAALADVTLDVKNSSITEAKLATNAVSTAKIQDNAVTTAKLSGDGPGKILGTNESGSVAWLDANDQILQLIIASHETNTILQDNQDGTFTYFNEQQVDKHGNIKPGAVGVNFDANTLAIDTTSPGIFIFKDKASDTPLATVNTRANAIIFQDNSVVGYTNVEEAITQINQKIEVLEQLEIDKAPLSGTGILINGQASVADAVFTAVDLSIANEAVTAQKIKGGVAKQLLITNAAGKAEWVDANHEIIGEIVKTQEKVTLLQDNQDGTFTYFNENDVNSLGEVTGAGITFDANTLHIEEVTPGTFEFYDKSGDTPLAKIGIAGTVIENITEILSETTVQNDIYNTVAAQGKAVTADAAINVVGGEKATLTPMTLSLVDQGITTAKIKNQSITEDKLFAGEGKANFVPVVQTDGSVKYQPMSAVVEGHPLTVDAALALEGDASKAVLQPILIKVKEEGIQNEHLHSHAVTADKISTANVELGAVLTADGSGNAVFLAADDAISSVMHGDLEGSESIAVAGGENVLFGDAEKKVVLTLKQGGVKGNHIAAGAVRNVNLADATIEATKLTAAEGSDNRIAVADATGAVRYQAFSATMLTEKGNISTDEIIAVSDQGVDKVLADVTLSINDTSIKADKLNAGNASPGAVATVGSNGVSVSYEPLTAAVITNKGSITTDGVVTVENGAASVLANVKLGIKDQGITTTQLADGAVQNAQLAEKAVSVDKISAVGVDAASVLVTRGDGEVVWGELGDIVTDTAGNLTTDDIIQMTEGDGTNTLLKDVRLSIADQSITRGKLSSKDNGVVIDRDRILVTDGQGGFDYAAKEAVQAGGEDLQLGSALAFTNNTDGLNVVLAPTSIDVKDGGISTAKLQDAAVTVTKMSAGSAAENSVLTAQSGGTVVFKELNTAAFDGQGADLLADESITVAADNKALLTETKIAVATDGIGTKHLKANAVTQDKISSKVNNENVAGGTILTADGAGNAKFQSLELVASTQGKAITATDGSLNIPNNKAALQGLNIGIATGGVNTTHLGTRAVTADKIGSGDAEEGLVLITDGQGGADFQNMIDIVADAGKALTGGTGITITGPGAAHALLGDASVNIKDSGVEEMQLANNAVTTKKLANKNVTIEKLSSKVNANNVDAGQVLASDGRGGVVFQAGGASTTGELKGSTSIDVTDGLGALLQDATVTVKELGIKTDHLDVNAVTSAKIATSAVTSNKIANEAVQNEHLAEKVVGETNLRDQAVNSRVLASNAVTNAKIANNSISANKIMDGAVETDHIEDGAVTVEKISAAGERSGYVLTVQSDGSVAYNAPAEPEVSTGDIVGDDVIDVVDGDDAVLRDMQLKIKLGSIESKYIAYEAIGTDELKNDAVGYDQLKGEAVHGDVIKDGGVSEEKISSTNEDGETAEEGYVLTADGSGGASFKPAKGGGGAGFFYAPSFVVDIEPGRTGRKNVYEIYESQFTYAISSRSGASLSVYEENELDYFVVYYDDDVFEDVSISEAGVLEYKVVQNPTISARTYFNVVMKLREE
ncbi:beta strand repeat-containing protein [Myroides sp. C8-3]|uniref:beta strand repeat-containing protein n=1 Tax=Myroides sp. C8-3 TaxID=3400533 RepID=UPI003D2F6B13